MCPRSGASVISTAATYSTPADSHLHVANCRAPPCHAARLGNPRIVRARHAKTLIRSYAIAPQTIALQLSLLTSRDALVLAAATTRTSRAPPGRATAFATRTRSSRTSARTAAASARSCAPTATTRAPRGRRTASAPNRPTTCSRSARHRAASARPSAPTSRRTATTGARRATATRVRLPHTPLQYALSRCIVALVCTRALDNR